MKLRQARKIYWAFYLSEGEQLRHKWNTFIKAQNIFVKHIMKNTNRKNEMTKKIFENDRRNHVSSIR